MTSMTRSSGASISIEPDVCSAISPLRSEALLGNLDRESAPVRLEVPDVHHLRQPDVPAAHQRLVNMTEERVRWLMLLDVGDEADRARLELLPHHVVGVPGDPRR